MTEKTTQAEIPSFRCSMLARLELCPGSAEAASRIQEHASEAAESGRKIHAALAEICVDELLNGCQTNMLTEAASEAARRGMDNREASVTRWFAEIVRQTCETDGGALEIHSEVAREMVIAGCKLTGSPDLIVRTSKMLHIFEYKSGQGDQETAEGHVQGQAYSLMAATDILDADQFRLHVLAAGNSRETCHTFCDYADEGLAFIQDRLAKILVRCAKKSPADHPPRVPSEEACRYCRASGTVACPESCAAVEKFGGNVIKMSDPVAIFMALAPAQRAATLEKAKLVAGILDKIIDAAKDGIKTDPAFIPGWEIGPGSQTREIMDATACWRLLNEAKAIDSPTYGKCVKAQLPKILEAYYDRQAAEAKAKGEKPMSKKESADWIMTLIQTVVEIGERSGSLRKIKVDKATLNQ